MEQSKLESLEETLVNVGTGFFISMIIQFVVVPLVSGYYPTAGQNILITLIFTVASVIRGFCVRRLYNKHRGIFIKYIRNCFK